MKKRPPPKNPIAKVKASTDFTLVELLVILAIIAVLTSVLLPALSKSRNTAREILCANNLKQLGIATASYANDYNGYCPNTLNLTTENLWDWQLMPYLNYPQDDNAANAIDRFSAFHCPSKKTRDGVDSHGQVLSKFRSRSYAGNKYVCQNYNGMALWGRHHTPSKTVLYCEFEHTGTDLYTFFGVSNVAYLAPTTTYESFFSYPHAATTASLLFSDLHAAKGKKIFSAYNIWTPAGTLWFNGGLICE